MKAPFVAEGGQGQGSAFTMYHADLKKSHFTLEKNAVFRKTLKTSALIKQCNQTP